MSLPNDPTTILDIKLKVGGKRLSIHRNGEQEYVALFDGVPAFVGVLSDVEVIQFLGTLFRKPLESGVLVDTTPTFGNMNSLKVTDMGSGLYNVDVGVARMGDRVSSEKVIQIMGGYLELGGVIHREWDDTFWGEVSRSQIIS